MQKQTGSKRYIFDGHAIGVAGRITHPFVDSLGIHAASALPSTGGIGSARVDGFRYKEIVTFGSAYSEVVGTEAAPGIFETVSLSVVERFNLLDVVTCERIVSRISSRHPADPASPLVESAIVPTGSRFEKLRIGNQFIERLEIASYFCDPARASWSGLLRALKENDQQLAPLSLPGAETKPAPLQRGGEAGFLGFCIALSAPTREAPLGAPLVFHVPQFGTVHLGEFFCYPTSRHLVMLRADLGCPVQGEITACDSIVDGGDYPP